MYEFEIVVGDWSCDGHNISERFTVQCSVTHTECEEKFKKLTKKFKDNPDKLTENYQQNKFTREQLKSMNVSPESIFDTYELEDCDDTNEFYIFSGLTYAKLFCEFISKNSEIQIRVIDTDIPSINIGGYGIYD